MDTITGTAAGVPYTALPPGGDADASAPLIVTWHMLDAPRTDAAFAAALPMTDVPAWRVHLGMPLCGARMVDGRLDRHVELAQQDALMAYFAPIVAQATDEFPPALAALRDQLPVDHGPIGVLGASLGGLVALRVLSAPPVPVGAGALVNAGTRVATAVGLVEGMLGQEYRWTDDARRTADELDFVAHADRLAGHPPLLVVSGEDDHPTVRADATDLVRALRARSAPDDVELVTVPELAHPLADEPGLEPAPQRPTARAVDETLAGWFRRRFTAS